MVNKIRTPNYTEYQLNKDCKITIWNDKTLSISLREDTVDLNSTEVEALGRVLGEYKVQKQIYDKKGGLDL